MWVPKIRSALHGAANLVCRSPFCAECRQSQIEQIISPFFNTVFLGYFVQLKLIFVLAVSSATSGPDCCCQHSVGVETCNPSPSATHHSRFTHPNACAAQEKPIRASAAQSYAVSHAAASRSRRVQTCQWMRSTTEAWKWRARNCSRLCPQPIQLEAAS